MNDPKKVLVFLSGRGSNCKALIQYQKNNRLCGFEIIGVITDKPGAPGMYYVKEANIPVFEFFRADYATRQEFLDAIFTQATNLAPEFYALAGFMVIVPPSFLQANEGKVINIHPSLLPAYPGLNTHTRALHDKQKTHGCTVHYVNEIVDGGAIIAQSSVVVQNDDTADTLAARVLNEEHRLYGWCLEKIAANEVSLADGVVHFSEQAKKDAAAKAFLIP